MRRLACFVLLAACTTTPAPIDAAMDDAGTDAPRPPRDMGTDTGFDAAILAPCTLAAPPAFDATSTTSTSGDLLQDRDFYVFTAIEHATAALATLDADPALTTMTTTRVTALHDADAASCDPACVRAALLRTDDAATIDATITALGSELTNVAASLRASHFYERFTERGDDDTSLVRTALTEAMANAASAFDSYAMGELPPAMLATVVHDVAGSTDTLRWWSPLVRVTTHAMIMDDRDEAIRHEPLTTTENAAAIAAIATTDFSAFPYVAILVPGQGPTDLVTPLNPAGAARCDIAVARWAAGLAPFLLLSGGHVHPDRTMYSEAIEMKHYLMTTYAVPESAILVDPYARHTTTNLRNAVRTLFAYGAPTDGRLLITSDNIQSAYIASEPLAVRCDDELFYRPFLGMQALSPTDACMTMAPVSLTLAGSDALDP